MPKPHDIVERVRKHDPLKRPLLVYLRPFARRHSFPGVSECSEHWGIGMPENSGPYATAVARRDFEGGIAKIAEPLGDLVIVGGEKTIGGDVSNRAIKEWGKLCEHSLCSAASVIFMVPIGEDRQRCSRCHAIE